MLYALTEIHRILQIGAWSLYVSFQNHNTQGSTGKFIYKPAIFYEKQLHLKQDQLRNHKVSSTLAL